MSTAIQWTQSDDGSPGETWNPTTGCDRISPGCDHCYALTMAKRLKGMGQAKYQTDGDPRTSGPGFGLAVHPDALDVPLRWRKPRRVFVNSMSDLFHARVPVEFIAQVWAVMAQTPQHTYQILTKRPKRMQRLIGDDLDGGWRLLEAITDETTAQAFYDQGWPLPNVWLGTSIESNEYTWRADALRQTSAAIQFLSLEPLLGPLPTLDLTGIDWVIIGGESGRGAREMDLGWVRELIAQCREAGAAIFVKQLGAVAGRDWGAGSHGGEWEHWPSDLCVREFPQPVRSAVA